MCGSNPQWPCPHRRLVERGRNFSAACIHAHERGRLPKSVFGLRHGCAVGWCPESRDMQIRLFFCDEGPKAKWLSCSGFSFR